MEETSNKWKKIKGAAIKLAVLGMAGLSFANAINPTINHLETAQQIRETQQYVQMVASEYKVANDILNVMKEDGLLDGFNYEMNFKKENHLKNVNSSASQVYKYGDITCKVDIGLNKNGLMSIDDTDFKGSFSNLLQGTQLEDEMYTQATIAHELGHCDFAKISSPFQIPGDSDGSAVLNNLYKNTSVDAQVVWNPGKVMYGLERHLNEAYAESYATITMIKAYNGSPEVQQMLNKKALGRDFSSSVSGYMNDSIDAYDIGYAIKNLNNPEKIQEILASSGQELKNMALENANATMFNTLGKMAQTQDGQTKINYVGSIEMVMDQATSSIYSSAYGNESLVGQALAKAASTAGYTYENYMKLGQSNADLTTSEQQVVDEMGQKIYQKIEESAIEILTSETVSADFEKGQQILQDLAKKHSTSEHAKIKTTHDVIDEAGEKLGLSIKDLKIAKKEFDQRLEARDEIIATNKTLPAHRM